MKSEEAARLIERLVRNLSHELKNPLTTIKGYAQLLALKSGDPASVEKSHRMIQEQVDRIDRMLQDLYTAFAPRTPVHAGFDAAETLREELSSFPTEVRVAMGTIPDVCPVAGDRGALLEMVNLLVRGFDWSGLPGARCTLGMSASGGRAVIDICFEGVDMPELSEPEFYLPFAMKKYYLKGTEPYEAFFIARACGWDITPLATGGDSRNGFRIWL